MNRQNRNLEKLRNSWLQVHMLHNLIAWLLMLIAIVEVRAQQPDVWRDVEYARVGEHSLKLDLYLPKKVDHAALIVWVHGGAWRSGSKSSMPLGSLVARGYAVASVDYRLTPVAPFPAQIHDLKAAVRFLRAKAGDWGFNGQRIAVAGASAGAHLAALVGVTNGDKFLEGTVGEHTGTLSDVQAIVSFYGMSNLTSILSQSTPHGMKVRVPALELLLGGQPEEKSDLARQASPVFHVDASDPPLLLLHGDQDPQAPINQSHELQGVYEKIGRSAQFVIVHGAAHGGDKFFDETRMNMVADFLAKTLTTVDGQDSQTSTSAKRLPDGRFVDLTHPFNEQTIYWPTESGFLLEKGPAGITERGYFYSANRFAAVEHGGTHVDAPIHFFAERNTVDQIPLERMISAGVVVDVTQACASNPDYQVQVSDFRAWEERYGKTLGDMIVLVQTGWSTRWPDRKAYLGTERRGKEAVAELHFPGLHPDAARWLVEQRAIRAVGIDTASIDFGQSTHFESHVLLCKHNVPAFENVANLNKLPHAGFTVIALPMKIQGGSGAPLRIVAVLP